MWEVKRLTGDMWGLFLEVGNHGSGTAGVPGRSSASPAEPPRCVAPGPQPWAEGQSTRGPEHGQRTEFRPWGAMRSPALPPRAGPPAATMPVRAPPGLGVARGPTKDGFPVKTRSVKTWSLVQSRHFEPLRRSGDLPQSETWRSRNAGADGDRGRRPSPARCSRSCPGHAAPYPPQRPG